MVCLEGGIVCAVRCHHHDLLLVLLLTAAEHNGSTESCQCSTGTGGNGGDYGSAAVGIASGSSARMLCNKHLFELIADVLTLGIDFVTGLLDE